jgi:hypothetical protein
MNHLGPNELFWVVEVEEQDDMTEIKLYELEAATSRRTSYQPRMTI